MAKTKTKRKSKKKELTIFEEAKRASDKRAKKAAKKRSKKTDKLLNKKERSYAVEVSKMSPALKGMKPIFGGKRKPASWHVKTDIGEFFLGNPLGKEWMIGAYSTLPHVKKPKQEDVARIWDWLKENELYSARFKTKKAAQEALEEALKAGKVIK
jgi:hypothetical protein